MQNNLVIPSLIAIGLDFCMVKGYLLDKRIEEWISVLKVTFWKR